MRLFKNLFVKKDNLTIENVNEKINIGQHFYFMKYFQHYSEFLEGTDNQKKTISELFLFRSWTTQFGFRLFSSNPELSEKLIGEVYNQGKFGKGMIAQLEQVNIEIELENQYADLIDSRWQEYDNVYINYKNSSTPIPTNEICGRLTEFCKINDPIKSYWICSDFIKQLTNIKQEAINSGLLKQG